MRMVVFGAAGGIGRHLVRQALAAGHDVTAVQHRTRISSEYQGTLHIVQGDLFDLSSVKAALQGQDVALGVHGSHSRKEAFLYTEGMENILRAMNEAGVKRLVCITSAAVDDDPAIGFFFGKIIKPLFLKEVYQALEQAEQQIEQSCLDWTIIRPGELINGPQTGIYRISDQGIPKGGTKIARADVAHLILKEATSTQYIRKKLVIVY